MPSPLGGASRLTIALIAAVAFALVLGSTYLSLCLAGEAMPPAPSPAIVFLFVMTGIAILAAARISAPILESQRRTEEGVQRVNRRIDAIQNGLVEHGIQLEHITGEIPRVRPLVTACRHGDDLTGYDRGYADGLAKAPARGRVIPIHPAT